jgi:hypothetical protein
MAVGAAYTEAMAAAVTMVDVACAAVMSVVVIMAAVAAIGAGVIGDMASVLAGV